MSFSFLKKLIFLVENDIAIFSSSQIFLIRRKMPDCIVFLQTLTNYVQSKHNACGANLTDTNYFSTVICLASCATWP